MTSTLAYAHTYPLAPCGGLFVLTVGVGIVLGAIVMRFRNVLLAAGGTVATLELLAFGASMTRPFGVPTPLQIWSLIVAVAVDGVLIALAIRRFRKQGDRSMSLGILLAVGVHFLVMTPAFGPLIALLGLLAILNAVTGLRSPGLSFRRLWLLDGGLKVAIGGALWLLVPWWAAAVV